MPNGHDPVAPFLIDAAADLDRRYPLEGARTGTVGDLAVLANNRKLTELVRNRGGSFTMIQQ